MNEYIQSLSAVLNALNTITVSGKHNLVNLSGSITVIEGVINAMVAELKEGAVEPNKDDK